MDTNRRIIVTGGAGFIGCNLVGELNRRGYSNILVVDHLNAPGKQANLAGLTCRDYQDKSEFRRFVARDPDEPVATLFHLGACSSTTESSEAYLQDNNFRYTQELCTWCLRRNIRFIYASSAATYGDGSRGYCDDDSLTPTLHPLNLYGWSKQHFDCWALEHRLLSRIVGLKYFNVFGPHEDHKGDMRSVVNKAFAQIRETGEIGLFKSYRPDYRDGEQTRDFVYVRDAVAVTLWFHEHPDRAGLFNCGTGLARSWIDLARAVFAAAALPPRIRFVEMPETIREKYQYHTQADGRKLRAAGYAEAFTTLEDGVQDYVHYLSDREEQQGAKR